MMGFAAMLTALSITLWLAGALALAGTRRLVFGQPKAPVVPETASHEIRQITFEVDGVTLHGWLAMPRQAPNRAILYFNGRKESPTALFTVLPELPEHAVMVFHRRGLRPSGGRPSEAGHVRDGLDALDWLCRHLTIRSSAVTIVGRSLGSGVAVQVAGAREVCSLVLLSAFDCLGHIVKHHYPWLPGFVLRDKFESIEHIDAVRCPCLSIVGDSDRVIPAAFSRALFDDWVGSVEEFVVAGGGHRGLLRNPVVTSVVAGFVKQQLVE